MIIPTQPVGGRGWKPAQAAPRQHVQPNDPPPEGPKPGHHWLGGHLSLESFEHWLHAKSEVVGLKADAVDTALGHVAHTGMSTASTIAASALGAASGALGLVLFNLGARDVKEGIEHRDWAHTVEGVGSLIVGTRSLAAGAATVGHLLPHSLLITETAGLAGKLVGPLGLVHGAIDTGLGVNQIVQGIRGEDRKLITKGALGIGMGASLMAAAAGAGIPALASAGLFLAGKVWLDVKN
ncbi:MAG: hypothetical protein KF760_29640 [Candidatus Eremiobacteraeota bacterium]|nr:hypothetical protein [Candidatus Eremiobacteraeota bacterium]MCW5872991.1 hypothetical protein [Candidatus Eremiobacteraeota bacterium]